MHKNTHRIKVRALIIKNESVLLVRHEHHDRPPSGVSWRLCRIGRRSFQCNQERDKEETQVVVSHALSLHFRNSKKSLLEVIFSCDYVSGKLKLGSDPDNPGIPTLVDAKWVRIDELGQVQNTSSSTRFSFKNSWGNLCSVELFQIETMRGS